LFVQWVRPLQRDKAFILPLILIERAGGENGGQPKSRPPGSQNALATLYTVPGIDSTRTIPLHWQAHRSIRLPSRSTS
jgi:hypothetical protein